MSTGDGGIGTPGDVGSRPKVIRRYDPDSDTELSLVIARSVAEAADLDPSELAEPMYGAVDPDAVERVFFGFATSEATTGRVVFEYCDHTVIVRSDGTVAVYD